MSHKTMLDAMQNMQPGESLAVERVQLLPILQGSSFLVQHQNYLKSQAEVVLKEMVQHLRSGTLTWELAACGLGRIAGYYDLLSEMSRQQRRLEEERRD